LAANRFAVQETKETKDDAEAVETSEGDLRPLMLADFMGLYQGNEKYSDVVFIVGKGLSPQAWHSQLSCCICLRM
jgi:hypothetical protein